MEKLKSFDKQSCKELRVEINEALKSVSEKYGISLSIGNISYNAESFKTRLEAKIDGAEAPAEDFSFLGYAPIGTQFRMQGRLFKILGHKPQRPKYPIVGQEISTGKLFKFSSEMVNSNIVK